MHKVAMEMGKWALEKAKTHGYDNLTSQDWDDLKDCLEVVKNAICADKDYREVELMDEEEEMYGRMGYRGRDSKGRFVHRPGRGRSAGYTPFMPPFMMGEGYEDEYEYPEMYGDYRMGYSNSGSRSGNSGGGRSGGSGNYGGSGNSNGQGNNSGSYGYSERNRGGSRRGETYDRYRDNRRHYTDTKDSESKKKMDESMKEYMDDAMDSMKEMWKDADPQLKQSMKAELTKLVQQLQ